MSTFSLFLPGREKAAPAAIAEPPRQEVKDVYIELSKKQNWNKLESPYFPQQEKYQGKFLKYTNNDIKRVLKFKQCQDMG